MDPTSAVAPGGRGREGRTPSNGRLCPHFGLLKILFLKRFATTKQRTMMEKEIITLKHNSCLMFLSILCEIAGNHLLYINLAQ